jgi:sulfur carrier protein
VTAAAPEIRLHVNGREQVLPAGTTVEGVLVLLGGPRVGVAVAVNGEVAPRSSWATVELHSGDRVEVLAPAQGG